MSDMSIAFTSPRPLREEPILIKTDTPAPGSTASLTCADGRVFPAQAAPGGILAVLSAEAGEKLVLAADGRSVPGAPVVSRVSDERIDIRVAGVPFCSYGCSRELPKPYLGPIAAPDGTQYTRFDLTATEHKHHRSLIVAVGDVNGIDFWNEREGHGTQEHRAFGDILCGSAAASFTAHNVWRGGGRSIADESRTFTFYNQRGVCRCVDIEITFTAAYGDVEFGRTKEAGPLGVRVNERLRVDEGSGTIVNSYGGTGERDCWGRRAHWCDYSGPIDGREYGITIFDNEKNPQYPTAWHVRDYGLFAPNSLYFCGGVKIPEGGTLVYRYRVIFHEGELLSTVSDRFVTYANAWH